MKTKHIVIACSVVFVLFLILVIAAGFFAYRHVIRPIMATGGPAGSHMPPDLQTPAVLTGSGLIAKSPFLEDIRLGSITNIAAGQLDPSPGTEIGIAGSQGALFLDKTATVKAAVAFGGMWPHVDIIDVDGDGVCEFMNRGAWGVDASLIDHNGNTVWTYGGMPGVDDMAAGDVDGDGILEFVVGFNGGGGVHLLDKNGKRRWRQRDGNVWHVEVVDTNGDGSLEIVHSNAAGQITVRDAGGNIIRRSRPSVYFSEFSLCKWPTKKDRKYALLSENDTIWLFDFDGKTVAEFKAPSCGTLGHARGVPVAIKSGQPEYFAVIVAFRTWERSILYVYDPTGTLVYQEILPDTCASIAALSLGESQTEALLIGGQDKVWEYRMVSGASD